MSTLEFARQKFSTDHVLRIINGQEFEPKDLSQIARAIYKHLEKMEIDTVKKEFTANELLKVADLIEGWFL